MIPRHLAIAVAVMFAVTIGMSVYIWRTRRMVPTEPAAYSHPVAPPVEAPTEEVTLYVAHDDIGALRAQTARIPLLRATRARGRIAAGAASAASRPVLFPPAAGRGRGA